MKMFGAALLCCVVFVGGCGRVGMQSKHVPVTSAIMHQLDLPVYPGAKPSKAGADQISLMGTHGVAVFLETSDDFSKVQDFYQHRLPSNARVMHFGIGSFKTIAFQFYAGAPGGIVAKQVSISGAAGHTIIQLQSTAMTRSTPQPSPT